MFNSINISSTALSAFSQALDAVSNNVSNLNTVGYKGVKVSFASQFAQGQGGHGPDGQGMSGQGVSTTASVVNFKAGDYSETKDMLQLAIDGVGFFVLKDGAGNLSYTRDGQFHLEDGVLVSADLRHVQGMTANGTLADIRIDGALALNAGAATQTLSYSTGAILSTGIPASSQPTSPAFHVYDRSGGRWNLSIRYTNDNPTPTPADSAVRWKIEVLDASGSVVATDLLTFTAGVPEAAHTHFTFPFKPGGSTALQLSLKLDYAKLQSFSSGTTATNIDISADGRPQGTATRQAFDADGNFVMSYSNGETNKTQRLALAQFDSPDRLLQQSGATFVDPDGRNPKVGPVGTASSKLKLGFIEKSNVDLSSEFSDIIVIQRGYQAATETISTANQMLGNLLDMKRGG